MERHILVLISVLHDQAEHGDVPLIPGFYSWMLQYSVTSFVLDHLTLVGSVGIV